MPRNLDRRVEILFPVSNLKIRSELISSIIPVQLHDTTQLRVLQPDGTYTRAGPAPGQEQVSAQAWLLEHRGSWNDGNS